MFKKTTDLLQIAFLSSLTATVIIYLLCYNIASDGLGFQEAALFSVLPGFIYFIVVLVVDTLVLMEHRKQLVKIKAEPLKWSRQLLILALGGILISFFIDYLYFLYDDSLPKRYATVLTQNINMNTPQDGINAFKEFTFYGMNLFINSFCIALASLISIFSTNAIFKRIQNSNNSLV
jgi:hypothetical protein